MKFDKSNSFREGHPLNILLIFNTFLVLISVRLISCNFVHFENNPYISCKLAVLNTFKLMDINSEHSVNIFEIFLKLS